MRLNKSSYSYHSKGSYELRVTSIVIGSERRRLINTYAMATPGHGMARSWSWTLELEYLTGMVQSR